MTGTVFQGISPFRLYLRCDLKDDLLTPSESFTWDSFPADGTPLIRRII